RSRIPYRACLLIGLGGLFAGVTGPLLSTFIPPLVRDAVGDHRLTIGVIMAIDNVLLLLLMPWSGPASDRSRASGRGRLPLIMVGLVLSSLGMALLPFSPALGLPSLIGAIIILHTGINIKKAPFQALVPDLVPSRHRSLATASITFQMCVGAIAFLMLGRIFGMRPAFLIASGSVLIIAAAFVLGLREPKVSESQSAEVTYRSLFDAAWSAVRGVFPGMRSIVIAVLLLQLTFQTFTTWYALHAVERFGIRPQDVTIGFIAWAMGGVIGALPAGFIGVRIGRRNAIMVGFIIMAGCMLALDRVTQMNHAIPLLALASASWALPTVNSYPLFVEPVPVERRGVLASLYLLCMALGGAVGDPLNGRIFDLFNGYRGMFLLMTCYTVLGFVAVCFVPRGAGEADTGESQNHSSGNAPRNNGWPASEV
ncbi:MAG TPA: MFS transporter, partial [Pyrinomonadaceae bacterium]|nr:MFS transporter [Pyrinomonadaceae bacterium]